MPGLADPNERLVERASKGDRRAFASIFERYHQRLYRYCAAIVGDPEDAREALQNTMVRVLGALPGERRKIELEPWLYRIAHNEAIEVVRRRRQQADVDALELAGEAGADASLESRERLRQLILDLRELPERQRGALVMRELGGLGFEQIGEALDTSARVARQTVYEARVSLQDMEGGRTMPCDEVRRKLSDGDRRLIRRRDVRAHLRQCARCRDFEQAIRERREGLAAIAPLPALAAGGLLQSLLGAAGGGAAGQGAAGAGAAGAGALGKAAGASVLTKALATGAVVAALGVAAADRSGVIQVLPGDGGSGAAPAGSGAPAPAAGANASSPPGGEAPASVKARAREAAAAARRGAASGSGRNSAVAAKGAKPGSGHGQHAAQAASNAQGAGAANAHGANPHANEHAGTRFNSGRSEGQGKPEGAPAHPPPPPPHSPPPHEPPPKPTPAAKAPPAGAEATTPRGQRPEELGEASE